MNDTAAPFFHPADKVSLEHDRSLKSHSNDFQRCSSSCNLKWRALRAVNWYNTVSSLLCQCCWQLCTFLNRLLFISHASLFLLFGNVILNGVVYPGCPWKNNEDLQNAKRHMGVLLIAVASYQSLKQMAYQLHGFVLDMYTTPHRGDLSKIMQTKDDGVHFKFTLCHGNVAYVVQ